MAENGIKIRIAAAPETRAEIIKMLNQSVFIPVETGEDLALLDTSELSSVNDFTAGTALIPTVYIFKDEAEMFALASQGHSIAGYVTKPFSADALRLVLEHAVFRHCKKGLLRASDFCSVLKSLAVGIILSDGEGNVLYSNPAAAAITGYSRVELEKKGLAAILTLGRESELKAHLLKDRSAGYPQEIDIYYARRDGTNGWIAVSSEMVANPGQTRFVVSFVDISEIKTAEQALWKYGGHLEGRVDEQIRLLRQSERMAAIGETALMLGHDLKNPLQAFVNAGLLLREVYDEANAPVKEYLDEANLPGLLGLMEKQARYMVNIVENLQVFAKREKTEPEPVNLTEIAALVVPMQKYHGIKIHLETDADMPKIMINPLEAQRILTNLVGNAAEALDGRGEIHVRVYTEGGCACLSVRDTGPGLGPEVLDKLFTPLFTTKTKGMGMGLAAVKKLTESHGGTITAGNANEGGALFTVKFPVLH